MADFIGGEVSIGGSYTRRVAGEAISTSGGAAPLYRGSPALESAAIRIAVTGGTATLSASATRLWELPESLPAPLLLRGAGARRISGLIWPRQWAGMRAMRGLLIPRRSGQSIAPGTLSLSGETLLLNGETLTLN